MDYKFRYGEETRNSYSIYVRKFRLKRAHGKLGIMSQGNNKAIPSQAWTGPKGSRRLRLPNFKTVGT
jgi:hypothetical protein